MSAASVVVGLRVESCGAAPLGPGLSATLWKDPAVCELASSCLHGCFVSRLADGSLDGGAFAGYVAQDKFFLEAFALAYALALAKVPAADTAGAREFASLVRGVVDELRLHASYAARLGVQLEGVTQTSHIHGALPHRAPSTAAHC